MKKEMMYFRDFSEMYAYVRGKMIQIEPVEAKVEEKPKKKAKKKEEKK